MSERWTLTRAGITNVYQYDDEILHFGGGRLLLRGVNGSGKSTAMNMLLPFLLEADTRRIDAAGEQSGVLRSWMLSGRDEAQPVGYLWVEFGKGSEHLVCGCGIRANRSTDRVTTWWFVTDRRPGIDFSLVENRLPLSVDSLRGAVGEQAVFTSDQRGAYRAAVRARLFGGADLDQHIRLLHVVRNPRVGDRIDVDLPVHLENALPPLSDAAIDDAAQPLEDLEEHRRNVDNLADTSRTLTALGAIYRDYARTQLHARAAAAAETAADARRQARTVADARAEAEASERSLAEADQKARRLETEIERIDQEVEALRASPAYQEGQDLDSQRHHVDQLAEAAAGAGEAAARASERMNRALQAVTTAHATVNHDHTTVTSDLTDLASLAGRVGLAERPPDAPAVTVEHHGEAPVPVGELKLEDTVAGVEDMAGAGMRRRADLEAIDEALAGADAAEEKLRYAERDRVRDEQEVAAAEEFHESARRSLAQAVERLATALRQWWELLGELATRHETDIATTPDEVIAAELFERRSQHHGRALEAADALADHHRRLLADLAVQLEDQSGEAARLSVTLDELNRRDFPDPPSQLWQRPGARPRLSELVDFAPHVGEEERKGVEAAMEAAGLLGAEMTPDGELMLETGDLVATGSDPVDSPLSKLVAVALPDRADGLRPEQVRGVLASISTDVNSPASTVVTTDGWFRLGTLAGRHHKEVVEHIGAGARKAALERQRAETTDLLEQAQAAVRRTESQMATRQEQLAEVAGLRSAIPDPANVSDALGAASRAGDHLEDCRARLDEAKEKERAAESAHSAAVAETRRLAAELGLPSHRRGLVETRSLVDDLSRRAGDLLKDLQTLDRSHRGWSTAADEWRIAGQDHASADERRRNLEADHRRAASRLATLEDTIGLDYAEVLAGLDQCRTDRDTTRHQLDATREARDAAIDANGRHRTRAEAAEEHRTRLESVAVSELATLRRVLEVPGLVTAAGDPDHPMSGLPGVAESSEGLAELAAALVAGVPTPESEVGGEGVRQSLRQRRDSLGAGWDAEDRQPDPDLPLAVEINGPLGHMSLAAAVTEVEGHRDRQASLLTAKQDQALRNLLQGLLAREVTDKLTASKELVRLMNARLATVATSHGVGVRLRWRRRDDLDPHLDTTIDLLAKPPDLRTPDEDDELTAALSARISDARRADPELSYRDLVREVLDYRHWFEMSVFVIRAGGSEHKLGRRTPLSEGEKKIISYLTLFSAVAASYDALAAAASATPRFVLLDDAFAKVSEDNHAQLFGLLVEMDLDFIATSERLWGTHSTVPELTITEVVRDADLAVIVLEHSHWNGHHLEEPA